jgi:hypothetical protein
MFKTVAATTLALLTNAIRLDEAAAKSFALDVISREEHIKELKT